MERAPNRQRGGFDRSLRCDCVCAPGRGVDSRTSGSGAEIGCRRDGCRLLRGGGVSRDFDGANAGGAAYRSKFTGKYSHQILDGIGHDVPQEAPQAFADAIIEVAGY